MRAIHKRVDGSVNGIRTVLCATLWTLVFDRFDPSLDEAAEQHFTSLMTHLKRPGELGISSCTDNIATVILWKAITVQSLSLANSKMVAGQVESKIPDNLLLCIKERATIKIVDHSLRLARALAEDGKGYRVSYNPSQCNPF